MPHKTKIARKPKGIGAELKSCACGESNVMLRLELQEGEEAMKLKEYFKPKDCPFHVAVTVRLVKPWLGTWRTVIADSVFASFLCAITLLSMGLHFMGIVKTATRSFPKSYFTNWAETNPQRGDHTYLHTTYKVGQITHKIVAVGWMTKLVKSIITTVGNCLPGNDQVIKRSRLVEVNGMFQTQESEKRTARCNLIERLFDGFSKIDIHDHYRQGILAIEESWKTHCWWHRFFATILGIIFTDVFFMYRADYLDANFNSEKDMLGFEEFLGILAYQMIHNDVDNETAARQHYTRQRTSTESGTSFESVPEINHDLRCVSEYPKYKAAKADYKNKPENKGSSYRARIKCRICKQVTSYYCNDCSVGDKLYGVCNDRNSSHRDCLKCHRESFKENLALFNANSYYF